MKKKLLSVLLIIAVLASLFAVCATAEDQPLEGEEGVEPRYDPETCPHDHKQSFGQTDPTRKSVGYTAGVQCTDCGKWLSGHEEIPMLSVIKGDLDDSGTIDTKDAVYLLYHVYFSSKYPANQDCNFNGDSKVDSNDAIYLLYHVYFPSKYPLH